MRTETTINALLIQAELLADKTGITTILGGVIIYAEAAEHVARAAAALIAAMNQPPVCPVCGATQGHAADAARTEDAEIERTHPHTDHDNAGHQGPPPGGGES